MKKLFLPLALAMVLAMPAKSQLQFGVEAGMNLTKLNFSDNLSTMANSDNMAGWYLGPKVNVTIPVVGLGLDAALVYSQKKIDVNGDLNTFRSFEVPVNVRYTLGMSSIAAIYLATGPQFGFNIGNSTLYEATASFKKEHMCVSWNVGGGVKLAGHLEIGLLYNFGISDYYKMDGASDYNFKGNSFQLQAAYLF